MKLLILVVCLSTAYCSENRDPDELENKERRLAGGGNYGGFIGLTTYGAGPFLVKGKFERDYNDIEKNYKEDISKNNDDKYNPEYVERLKDEQKDNDEYFEYLGYDGPPGCVGKNRYEYGNVNRRNNLNFTNFFDNEVQKQCDKVYRFTGPTANDEPENLVRPCALDDRQCIRNYFAANSKCKPAVGPIPDPLYIDVNTVFVPVVNMTLTLPNLMVTGLSSAKIREFYVNKKSGNLVLALDITNLNETAPRAYFRYKRTAKESIVLADFATVNFRAITFTAIIPKIPHLRLDLADIHADIQDGTPKFFIGPGAANSTDPDVVTAFAQINLFLPFVIRESLLFQSQLFTSIYIQENICDFGLKIISV